MRVKIITCGEGANIPGVNIGMSVILFNLYISPNEYRGYTGASNEPALGNFSFSTEDVPILNVSEEKKAKWNNLHGKLLYVKMRPSHFLVDGGIVEFELTLKDFSSGKLVDEKLEFIAENCTGWSITESEINFRCELFVLAPVEP